MEDLVTYIVSFPLSILSVRSAGFSHISHNCFRFIAVVLHYFLLTISNVFFDLKYFSISNVFSILNAFPFQTFFRFQTLFHFKRFFITRAHSFPQWYPQNECNKVHLTIMVWIPEYYLIRNIYFKRLIIFFFKIRLII